MIALAWWAHGCHHDSLAIGADAVDQSSARDLAAPQGEVVCGVKNCASGDGCCATHAGDPVCALAGISMQCDPGQLWRCDGPEDCGDGTECVGRGFVQPFTQPRSTACEAPTPWDPSQHLTLCHLDSDCPGGMICADLMLPPPTPPQFRACVPLD